MDRQVAMEEVNKLEIQYPVYQWKAGDIHIWPLVRIPLLSLLYGKGGKSKSSNTENKPFGSFNFIHKKFNSLKRLCLGWSEFHKINKKSKTGIDIYIASSVVQRQKVNDVAYNRFCDIFIEYRLGQGKHVVNFEFQARKKSYTQAASFVEQMIDGDAVSYYFQISKGREGMSIHDFNLPKYDDFINELNIRFGEKIAKRFKKERLLKEVNGVNSISKMYEYLIDASNVKPKALLAVSYYNSYSLALMLAGSRKKIPTIDIQHGVQGAFHESYGRWFNSPKEGYNLLPKYFWVWDESSKKNINDWALNTNYHEAYNGGNPWLQYWNHKRFDQLYNFNEIKKKTRGRKVVLYSLQPSFEAFPEYIKDVIRNTSDKMVWWVRVHPRQLGLMEQLKNQIGGFLQEDNIIIDEPTGFPLFALLKDVDVHITVYSTVAIEATYFSVPTIFLDKFAKLYFEETMPDEFAYYCKEQTSNELEVKLLELVSFKNEIKQHIGSENAISSIVSFFDKELRK